ncbi:tRNA-intron lyase, partial [Candidatus Bathyarchaeota archaeon]|nr:tRNA-intron lyase [Candidatus Bathyarchaeota archaeon]
VYLVETKKIKVISKFEEKVVCLSKLRKFAKKLYENFEEKYTVYRDLRSQGLIVTPGMKFGCDFAVYQHGPGLDHAPYMVSVKKANDDMTATDVVKAGRLATTVRKRFIIAIPDLEAQDIRYLIFKWFKA